MQNVPYAPQKTNSQKSNKSTVFLVSSGLFGLSSLGSFKE
jgi:hypothetical protein